MIRMEYKFNNTERNNKKASDYETKSLLYLLGKREDSKEIEYVTFDCFNDVSGVNKNCDEIWDIQSKNEKSLNPKKIGKYLFTLFDNSTSIFSFREFIFFAPPLNPKYKIDEKLTVFGLKNIESQTYDRIKKGLLEEIERVLGNTSALKNEIEAFLDKVIFVEDTETENEYVKSITKFRKTEIKSDAFYDSIFRDIRDIQTAKKNTYIENSKIEKIREVLIFNRHLTNKEVEVLIVSRIIGCEIFEYKSIPLYFSVLIDNLDIEDKKDKLQECNSNLSRAFFNKNSNRRFWEICEEIIVFLDKVKKTHVEEIYTQLFSNVRINISYLTPLTIKYLISIILEGKE